MKIIGISVLVLGMLLSGAGHADHTHLARDFDFSNLTPGQELGCLALNIYHEGRGEVSKGQAAIAAVTMNRVRSEDYPDTICGVVWQKKQFSWTHINPRHHIVTDLRAWQRSLAMAEAFLNHEQVTEVGNATHYHAVTVQPYWASGDKLVTRIGNHYFYML